LLAKSSIKAIERRGRKEDVGKEDGRQEDENRKSFL
jgi:hypothetical protein